MKQESLQHTVTQLLVQWRSGDSDALNRLMPLVYNELRRMARFEMHREREGHTLQHTALVHEAYLQLVNMDVSWNDRAHFYAVAARAMRHILVDHARKRKTDKRGGELAKVTFDEAVAASPETPVDLLDLDRTLERLTALDARKGEVIELYYFGGLNREEIAEVIGVAPITIDRELRVARAWMNRELGSQDQAPGV